jgi:hypothetical protein
MSELEIIVDKELFEELEFDVKELNKKIERISTLTCMILTESKEALYYFLNLVFPDYKTIIDGSDYLIPTDGTLGTEIFTSLQIIDKTNSLILDFIHYFIKNRNKYDINTQNDSGYTLLYILVWYLDYWKESFLENRNNHLSKYKQNFNINYDILDEFFNHYDDLVVDNKFTFYNPNKPSNNYNDDYYSLYIDNYILNQEELDYYLERPYLVLYEKKYFSKRVVNICIQFKKYIKILLHDNKTKLRDNDIQLINGLGDPDIIRWMNKRISKKAIQDIPNVKVSPMKSLYSMSKKHAAKVFSSKKNFLMKQNKLTKNKYRQFLNIAKQNEDIRRHSSPNSSLFYKSKTKRNTRSRKSV